MAGVEHASVPSKVSISAPRGLLSDQRVVAIATATLATAAGLLTSAVAPRGPTTVANGLLAMGLALAFGIGLGAIGRSRWLLLPALVLYLLGVELGRLGVVGASLAVRLDNPYGIIALALTRGLHVVLVLPALTFGLLLGIALARRLGWAARLDRSHRPFGTGLLGVVVAALVALVAWPASTPPVLGPDGRPAAGSMAELASVPLGGSDQTVLIRAASADKPVLLYLSGGPGQSDLGFGRVLLEPLTADFVVAIWDQRGTGRSYPALDPTTGLTLERAVSDTIELADYLRARFNEDKIYVLGESWGSTLGVLAVQARPDLFHAYIGSGQMVSQRETDRIIWRDLLAYADRVGDGALYDQVLTLGEPPYRDTPWSNSIVMGAYPLLETSYTPPASYIERGVSAGIGPYGVLASEYGFLDKANAIRGLIDMFSLMYPQLQTIDFRTDVPELEVPVYLLDGANELRGRRELAHEWFDTLTAPTKELITYEDAGHSVVFEEVDAFHRFMTESVLPATYGG